MLLIPLALANPLPTPVDTPPTLAAPSSSNDRAVVIGIETYEHLPVVPYAARDAAAFEAWLLASAGLSRPHIRSLRDGTFDEVTKVVSDAAGEARASGGRLWLYFAGHGSARPEGDASVQVLVLSDAVGNDATDGNLTESQLWQLTRGAQMRLVVDACADGSGRDQPYLAPGRRLYVPNHAPMVPPPGLYVFRAASPGEAAIPLDPAQHGLFTYLYLGATRGWADRNGDHRVTGREAEGWMHEVLGDAPVQRPRFDGPSAEADLDLVTTAKEPWLAPVEVRAWLPFIKGTDFRAWLQWRREVEAALTSGTAAIEKQAAEDWTAGLAAVQANLVTREEMAARFKDQYLFANKAREGELRFAGIERLEDAWEVLGRPPDTGEPGYGDEGLRILGGSFLMGSPEEEHGDADEKQHRETVATFEMARTPVTQALYAAYKPDAWAKE